MAGADPVEEEEAGVAAPSKGTEKDEVVVGRIEIKVEHEVEGETVGTASVTTGPGIGPGSGSGMPEVKLELSNEVPTVEELIDQSTLPELPDAPNVEQLWDAANRPTNVAVGTKLLAEHDGQLYIAVVRSVSDLGPKVHFNGWHARHDRVVSEEGLVEADEAGLALQAGLRRAIEYESAKTAYAKAYAKALKAAESQQRKLTKQAERERARAEAAAKMALKKATERRERRPRALPVAPAPVAEEETSVADVPKSIPVPEHVQTEDQYYNGPAEVRVPITDELKVKLVDDWAAVTQKDKLVRLPRNPSISTVMAQFVDTANSRGWSSAKVAHPLTERLKRHFRENIGTCLLYPQEYEQFRQQQTAAVDADACDIYGPEHLLRLFTTLPAWLALTALDRPQTEATVKCLQDILRFLTMRSAQLFPAEAFEKASSGHSQKRRKVSN